MSSQEVEILPAKTKRRRKDKKLTNDEIKTVLNYAIRGLEPYEIAKATGLTSIVCKDVIDRHKCFFEEVKELQNVEAYKNLRNDLFNVAEIKTLRSLTNEEKHKKASLGQVATAFKTIHTARRLEEDLSTENIAKEVKYTHKIEDV